MADLTFGQSLGMLDDGELIPWVKTIFKSVKIGVRLIALRLVPGMTTLQEFFLAAWISQAREAHLKYSSDRVDERLRNPSGKPDIWDQILKKSSNDSLSLAEMHSNAGVFMTAGTETSATLLSGLTYLLLKNPASLQVLTQEVRAAFPNAEAITIEGLQRLRYLHGCIEEGLRMYPPVAQGLPRITPRGGTRIDSAWIPGGITVQASPYAGFYSTANFAEPYTWAPERWLGEDKRFANDDRAAFQPFSVGPRSCIGKSLAYHEMRLLLASVLLAFDLQLDPASKGWMESQKAYIVWEKTPLMVRLTPAVASS